MAHVKRGVQRTARRRKLLTQVKSFRGRRKNTRRVALQAADRAGQFAYRGRREHKRRIRRLWIMRINAAARAHGMSYSHFMGQLKSSGIAINRKMLAELALRDQAMFAALAGKPQSAER